MPKSRKVITFDLDTQAMKQYYPSNSWNNGYDVIKKHMKQNGFNWQQGSVYISEKPMTHGQVQSIIREFIKKHPWINKCMRDCKEANIGRGHDLNYFFDKNANVMTRDEMNQNKYQTNMNDLRKRSAERKKQEAAEPPSDKSKGQKKNERGL